MKWTRRDEREEPPREALVGSLLLHGALLVVAVVLALARPEPLVFETYQIEIVSAPPVQAEEEQRETPAEELTIDTPDEPEPVEEAEAPIPDPDPEPAPPEPDPVPEETPPETPPDSTETETETTTTEEVEETSAEPGEDMNVRMEGLRRDYPQYYGNIVRQIARCWRPPRNAPEGLSASVYFVIRADGTVADTRMVERSGSSLFDGLAVEAIAGCASGRFGSLPADLGYERLPIQFEFTPARDDVDVPSPDLSLDDA